VYRPARSEKVIGMTILGARVVLVLRAQAAYPRPSEHAFAAADRLPTISRGSSKPSRPEPLRTKLAQLGSQISWQTTVAHLPAEDIRAAQSSSEVCYNFLYGFRGALKRARTCGQAAADLTREPSRRP